MHVAPRISKVASRWCFLDEINHCWRSPMHCNVFHTIYNSFSMSSKSIFWNQHSYCFNFELVVTTITCSKFIIGTGMGWESLDSPLLWALLCGAKKLPCQSASGTYSTASSDSTASLSHKHIGSFWINVCIMAIAASPAPAPQYLF